MPLLKSKSTSSDSQSSPPTRKRSIFSSNRQSSSHSRSPSRKRSIFSSSRQSQSRSPSPPHKRSIFSPNSHDSTRSTHDNSSAVGSGLFGRRRSNSSDNESAGGNGFFGLGRSNNIENDQTIRRAREKVAAAEKAEKQADIALNEARNRVSEARQLVKILEQEAEEG